MKLCIIDQPARFKTLDHPYFKRKKKEFSDLMKSVRPVRVSDGGDLTLSIGV